jgi:hypothetical protein
MYRPLSAQVNTSVPATMRFTFLLFTSIFLSSDNVGRSN